ncbi:hypothetical protein RJ639_003683 [Escallonia herrerae]|uniref:Rubisco LSMT substrate-binding domain-containing protein n=1 Tax=Escallonia herrerae TaxID=1293975 RepID=A0AA89AWX2_9ASTE|nr:hypothetical protein RJ639_003683 [Escallonia herrerae]
MVSLHVGLLVIADCNYAPGDQQVFIRYGKFSNATLLLDFGFTLPYNNYDQVQVEFSIPHHDCLRALKLELLNSHFVPTVKDVNGFNSSGSSFIIKEVMSASGKGRGIPQSLRAYAHVLCSSSHQELSDMAMEAAQSDGRLARVPLKNRTREIQAHQFLLSKFSHLVEEYNACLKSLGPPTAPCMFENVSLRRQQTRDLLTGELRVLKSASAWLKYYCERLT